jgi:hypothetical protein
MRQQQLDYERHLPAWTPRRHVRLAMIVGPLLVSTLLPIWTVWYIGPWEATGEAGPLWRALGMLPDNVRAAGFSYVASLSGSNLVTAGFLLLLGFGVERLFVIRGRRAAA